MSYDKEYWAREIGHTVHKLRKNEGLSLEQLSLLSGATIPNLSKIERGKANITLSTMVSICNALGITLPELFTGGNGLPKYTIQKAAPWSEAKIETHQKGYNLEDDE